MGSGYTGKKVQHGTGAVERYTGPSINISSLPLDLQYAVCRYAAKFTYGRDAVRGVFGNAVKTGPAETVGSVNSMINLGGMVGARPEEAAAFEAEHPEWAATVKAYVDWARGRTPARR